MKDAPGPPGLIVSHNYSASPGLAFFLLLFFFYFYYSFLSLFYLFIYLFIYFSGSSASMCCKTE